ncbi:hypothetical protein NEPAR04_1124 [Nematocida parisii]|nr:hypothetical protein NEPAR08_0932 [Nematocida parisii]KAI5127837.1 hypothetical protein NEPAR03_1117 [Nematocida parisii]KAI5141647.1 hypothetical protein NEPAR04_1124 [Nematocida parisii]
MLLRVGLQHCYDENCFNNQKERIITTEELYQQSTKKYCDKCIEEGFDYVYTNDIVFNRGGEWQSNLKLNTGELVEDSLILRKIKRRGFIRSGAAYYGLFSKKEYSPNEIIGFIGGAVSNINMVGKEKQKKVKSPSRCFIFRENGLVLDSRKSGNLVRFIRRSCRPNVGISLEVCEDGWKGHPPLKKNPFIVTSIRARLYAISRIDAAQELFIGNSYSSHLGENWVSSELNVEGEDLVDSCSCNSDWNCLFRTKPPQQKTKQVKIKSKISSMFVKMQKYTKEKVPFISADMAYVLNRKCTFMEIP